MGSVWIRQEIPNAYESNTKRIRNQTETQAGVHRKSRWDATAKEKVEIPE